MNSLLASPPAAKPGRRAACRECGRPGPGRCGRCGDARAARRILRALLASGSDDQVARAAGLLAFVARDPAADSSPPARAVLQRAVFDAMTSAIAEAESTAVPAPRPPRGRQRADFAAWDAAADLTF